MEKRTFLKTGMWLAAAAALSPLIQACKTAGGAKSAAGPALPSPKLRRTKPFELPALSYDAGALEPHIDKMTMEIHHGKHHAAYVTNLNEAVANTPFAEYELDDILARVTGSDADKKIRNNGGGHWNHTFFWKILAPNAGGTPTGSLSNAINTTFGSYTAFRDQFSAAAKSVFGSGWAWLIVGKDGKLAITTTPNQDNPLMLQLVKVTGMPIVGLDVWEHAYYLKYQNKRPDYIAAFFNVINWKQAQQHFDAAMTK